jgi:hypothetical protein
MVASILNNSAGTKIVIKEVADNNASVSLSAS